MKQLVGASLSFLRRVTASWEEKDQVSDSIEGCLFQFDRFKEF